MTLRRLAVLLVAVVAVVACEPDAGDEPRSAPSAPPASPTAGGRLVVGVYGEPATFDPYSPVASDLTRALARPLYRSLFRFEDDGEPVADLAAGIRVSGDIATIRLGNALWSDGAPITARDVVVSLRRADLDRVEDVSRRGRNTIVLSGRIDDWPAFLARSSYVLPFDDRRAYSGPFALASRVPGLQLVLQPNPEADQPALLNRLTVRFTEGVDMLLALLDARKLDVAWVPSSVNISARLEELGLDHDTQLGWQTVVLDLRQSDLARRQRRSVAAAVDRRHMAEAFVRDHGRVIDTLEPDLSAQGASGPYEGVFRGESAADDVALRVAAPSGDELLELIQRLAQVQLTSAGFEVELINVDARRFYGEWSMEAPVDVSVARRMSLLAGDAEDDPRSAHELPLFQVDSVVAWVNGVGGVDAAVGPEGPLADAHEWHVVPEAD